MIAKCHSPCYIFCRLHELSLDAYYVLEQIRDSQHWQNYTELRKIYMILVKMVLPDSNVGGGEFQRALLAFGEWGDES